MKLAYLTIFATVCVFLFIGMTAVALEEKLFMFSFAAWWFLILCVAYYRKYDK